jgi:hypothetical protein
MGLHMCKMASLASSVQAMGHGRLQYLLGAHGLFRGPSAAFHGWANRCHMRDRKQERKRESKSGSKKVRKRESTSGKCRQLCPLRLCDIFVGSRCPALQIQNILLSAPTALLIFGLHTLSLHCQSRGLSLEAVSRPHRSHSQICFSGKQCHAWGTCSLAHYALAAADMAWSVQQWGRLNRHAHLCAPHQVPSVYCMMKISKFVARRCVSVASTKQEKGSSENHRFLATRKRPEACGHDRHDRLMQYITRAVNTPLI